jgi:peptidyl-prolyl cis-trans isomerase C
MMRPYFRAALKEPLVHFLIAGLAVFVFFAYRGVPVDPESRTITVNETKVEALAASWAQTMQRQPNAGEVDALIREYIKEEVYAREALRLGLEQDDPIIRRRLRSKMEFLAASQVESAVPSDATLQKMLEGNPAKYAQGSQYSFDQIYLDASNPDQAKPTLQKLAARADWRQMGAAISLPRSLENTSSAEIAKIFGPAFAERVANLKSGAWAGPIESGYGLHLVRMRSVKAGQPAQLNDIRQRLENDWRAATVEEREAAAYQALLDGYTIKIAKP